MGARYRFSFLEHLRRFIKTGSQQITTRRSNFPKNISLSFVAKKMRKASPTPLKWKSHPSTHTPCLQLDISNALCAVCEAGRQFTARTSCGVPAKFPSKVIIVSGAFPQISVPVDTRDGNDNVCKQGKREKLETRPERAGENRPNPRLILEWLKYYDYYSEWL